MGRPRTKLRSNPENIRELVELQETRFLALVCFCDELEKPKLQEAVKVDDVGFKKLIWYCFEEFGVSKTELARRLNVSGAAVGRWANPEGNFPPAYNRPTIIQEVAKILREHINAEYVRQRANDATGIPTVLMASMTC